MRGLHVPLNPLYIAGGANSCQQQSLSIGGPALQEQSSEHLLRKHLGRVRAPSCSALIRASVIADGKLSHSSFTRESVFSLASPYPPLSLHRCSKGGRMAKLTFSGNGPSTGSALGTWRRSFGWVMPPHRSPLEGCSDLSTSRVSMSIWNYHQSRVCWEADSS